jgi:hypothetical protein
MIAELEAILRKEGLTASASEDGINGSETTEVMTSKS